LRGRLGAGVVCHAQEVEDPADVLGKPLDPGGEDIIARLGLDGTDGEQVYPKEQPGIETL
jgi:hypothetical protein